MSASDLERERTRNFLGNVYRLLLGYDKWAGSISCFFMSDDVSKAILPLQATVESQVVPGCPQTCNAIGELIPLFDRWYRDAAASNDGVINVKVPERLWECIEEAGFGWAEECHPPLPRETPVRELILQKVAPWQIAAIYGWRDEFGGWDTNKVTEESNEPGTHTKDHKTPAQRKQDAEIQKKKEWIDGMRLNRQKKVERKSQADERSIEELLKFRGPNGTGLSADQIARMKCIPKEQLIEYCRHNKLDTPASETLAYSTPWGPDKPAVPQEVQDIFAQQSLPPARPIETFRVAPKPQHVTAPVIDEQGGNDGMAALFSGPSEPVPAAPAADPRSAEERIVAAYESGQRDFAAIGRMVYGQNPSAAQRKVIQKVVSLYAQEASP
jgi:hypothetical protein